MKDWRQTLITPETSIREAMRIIDSQALQIAMVVGPDKRLLGMVTDGDIRRGLLKGLPLEDPVRLIMNQDFSAADSEMSSEEIFRLMKTRNLRQIPVLDDQGRAIALKLLEDMIQPAPKDNWVVLMAGGLGTRLWPFTEKCPKPLLRVGDKPVLETILETFIGYGFRKYFISVNYKGEMIEVYFGDGSRWGVDIEYLREKKHLGTAGALGLLRDRPAHPLLVMNGDVLTNANLQHLLDFHQAHQAKASMCVREYHFQVPYGVIRAEQHLLRGIEEKPVQRFFVNAGIYVLDPEILDMIPKNRFLDMPDLFLQIIDRGRKAVVFPLREYWIDIGKVEDLEKAHGEYHEFFK